LRLTKSLKIRIIGLTIALISLSLWGFNVFLAERSGVFGFSFAQLNFYFAIIVCVGMLILYYGDRMRQREKENLDNK
jgi:hypothetical protein